MPINSETPEKSAMPKNSAKFEKSAKSENLAMPEKSAKSEKSAKLGETEKLAMPKNPAMSGNSTKFENPKKRRIFFADERSILIQSNQGRCLKIKGDDYLHMRKVLRLEKGAKVEIFLKNQQRYYATLLEYEKDAAVVLLQEQIFHEESTPSAYFRLFLAIPRPAVLAAVTHKLVELGVSELCPVLTQRSMVTKPSDFNLMRYEKIAKEAMKQSRSFLPLSICPPLCWSQLPKVMQENAEKDASPTLNLLCDEVLAGEQAYVLDDQTKLATKTFNLFVGSEGGMTRKEVALLQELGFQTIALHRFILRVETAVVFALARLM